MKKVFLGLSLLFGALNIFAQSNEALNLKVEARADFQQEYLDGKRQDPSCGFKGKYLNISMSGKISEEFSYAYRQRLNKAHADQSFFDATDWVYLTYKKGDWSFSAGKLVVGIGGYEYDRSPVDLYFCSEYWNNIPCYELGINVEYQLGKNDKILAQICESPFRKHTLLNEEDEATYAYNLMWYGSHDWFQAIYSVNMMEYAPGKFISYIALGNKFNFGKVALELDIMNRANDEHAYFGKNLSVMGELCWHTTRQLNLLGKMTYDVNKTHSIADLCVDSGTEISRVGAGVEFFPLKDGAKDIRLHAAACYTFGSNGNSAGVLMDKQTMFEVGVTWRMNVLSLKK